MLKKWEFYDIDLNKVAIIKEKFNLPEIIATTLVNRGIVEDEKIRVFLNPTRNDFYNPFEMPDCEIAVDRIIKAIENNEKTIIYGDYDVDGITSTTVLKNFLAERGLNVDYYIPNRLDEGYGLNKQAVEKIASEGYTLMITVDCGITSVEEVEYASKLGIETIITDHHETAEKLPKALAVMDAKRKDNKYPFTMLAGVGVVFKLIQALSLKLNLDEKEYLKYLDIVCVGTISDIVPLVDENRSITKLGLKLVEQTKNIGLKALIKSSGYKQVDSNMVSFGIAPRINACGRMGYEKEGLKLFLAENVTKANEITAILNNYNNKRQQIEKTIFEEATKMINEENIKNEACIVLAGENWHHGVIGIVASKITEKYHKPCILLCIEDELAKGSGRSIEGFDLHEALFECDEYLEKYGGHAMAIGLALKKENIDNFRKKLNEIAIKHNLGEFVPTILIDKQINANEINVETVKQLNILEPFGEANRRPVFLYKGLKIEAIRTLSEGKHLKLDLKDSNTTIKAIGFNLGNLAEEYLIGDKVDIVGNLEINEFNGYSNVQLNLKDVRKSI